jgi:hypothetical protein
MADSAAKRIREAKKRQHREIKAERKRLRKEGLLGHDNTGLFPPGERPREVFDPTAPVTPPPPQGQP